jgi:Carboxypeptidase regulatory-like domain
MKFVFVLFLLLLVFALSCESQICGPSRTKIYVRDSQGGVITDVKFEFVGLNQNMSALYGNWQSFGDGAYYLEFLENKPYGDHLLRLSAKGFLSIEHTVKIREAQRQVFNVTLQRPGTGDKGQFKRLSYVFGTVFDVNKAVIPSTEISVQYKANNVYRVKTDSDGHYEFELPIGEYEFQYLQSGFKLLKMTNINIGESEVNMRLDVVLDIRSCNDCDKLIIGEDPKSLENIVVVDHRKLKIDN